MCAEAITTCTINYAQHITPAELPGKQPNSKQRDKEIKVHCRFFFLIQHTSTKETISQVHYRQK